MTLKVTRKKGEVQVPVYMRDYTEPAEYNYVLEYRGFKAYLIRLSVTSWWIASDGKWVITGIQTKQRAERSFVEFVDKHYTLLVEKGFIEERSG